MKKTTTLCILFNLLLAVTGIGQVEGIRFSVKPLKDTLYPFDILEFRVDFKNLKQQKILDFYHSTYLQIKMLEPEVSEWVYFSGLETGDFGTTTNFEGYTTRKLEYPADFAGSDVLSFEFVPDLLKFTSPDVLCPNCFRPGKYLLRVAYAPYKHIGYYANELETSNQCIVSTAVVVVSDHYPEPDQAAYEWLKKDKASCAIFRTNYASHYLEGFISLGEEFLKLFPESSFTPAVHCKIGESMIKIYEKNAEETKLPPVEAGQKLEAIVKHLGYCRQMDAYYQLGNYYGRMYRQYKDYLLRFKIRHGLK